MRYIELIVLLFCTVEVFAAPVENSLEQTFAMIKPYAVQEGKTDEIIDTIKKAGFAIIAMKKIKMTVSDVHQLYEEHQRRRWFARYVKTLTASPAVLMILEKENAVEEWDQYKKIIRASYFMMSKKNNVVHGSDSVQAAQREIDLFFKDLLIESIAKPNAE